MLRSPQKNIYSIYGRISCRSNGDLRLCWPRQLHVLPRRRLSLARGLSVLLAAIGKTEVAAKHFHQHDVAAARREAHALQACSHTNVVLSFGFHEFQDLPCLCMEALRCFLFGGHQAGQFCPGPRMEPGAQAPPVVKMVDFGLACWASPSTRLTTKCGATACMSPNARRQRLRSPNRYVVYGRALLPNVVWACSIFVLYAA